MRLFFLLSLGVLFCCETRAQDFILDKRTKVKKKVEKFYHENNRKYLLTESDSTLTYVLNDSLSLPATYIYYFNENNRCKKQETIYNCDSCLQKGIQQSLANKFVNWQKAGGESYYAKFPYNTLMEPVLENGKYILRYTWIKRKDLNN